MSQNQNYQQHIQSAIQNVLSKVKSPERAKTATTSSETPQLKPAEKPLTVKPKLPQRSNTRPAGTGPLTRKPIASQTRKSQTSELTEPTAAETAAELEAPQARATAPLEEAVYLEAEDLYTPLPLEEESDAEADIPLIEDQYSPPYNLFEEFVETELNILLSRYLDLCRCSQCRADIVALALHQLPAYYVTGTRGTLTAKSVVWTRYMQQVMDAVTKAIHIVYKRPRPSCRRIKQMIWLKPELEVVSESDSQDTPQYFGSLHQNDSEPELSFSEEVNQIIQTLEAAPVEDKAELLPVFSPLVQNAYHSYEPESQSAPAKESQELEPDAMQLLEIDDWDTE